MRIDPRARAEVTDEPVEILMFSFSLEAVIVCGPSSKL